MNKIYISENYIIIEQVGKRPLTFSFRSLYGESTDSFIIFEKRSEHSISFSEVGTYFDEAGTTAYTEETLRTFLRQNTGKISGGSNGVTGVTISQQAINYSAFVAGNAVGELAYAEQSEGTKWLPGSYGGTYYPSGIYLWDGANWVSSREAIALELQGLVDDTAANTISIVTNATNISSNSSSILTNITNIANNAADILLRLTDALSNGKYYVRRNGAWTSIDEREDFILIKSGAELEAEFPPVAGVITLTKNVEIQGTISTSNQLNTNGFYYIGKNAFSDIHNYTGTSDAFVGANSTIIKLMTLVSSSVGSSVFNVEDTVGDKSFILRDVVVANSENVGLVKGFDIVVSEVCNFVNNSSGITYEDITHLFLNNLLWDSTNQGTLESLVGTFDTVQSFGGVYETSAGVTAFDVTGVTSVNAGELVNKVFEGAGTYVNGTFSVDWLVDCVGVEFEGDKFSQVWLKMIGNTTNLPLTQNTWEFFPMATATLDPKVHRFQQLAGFPDTIQYIGKETIETRVVATFDLSRVGGGVNRMQMRAVYQEDGGTPVIIDLGSEFEINAVDNVIPVSLTQEFTPNALFWFEIRNITDDDDILLRNCSITIK